MQATSSWNPREGFGAFESLHSKKRHRPARSKTRSISAPLDVRKKDGFQRSCPAMIFSIEKPSQDAPAIGLARR